MGASSIQERTWRGGAPCATLGFREKVNASILDLHAVRASRRGGGGPARGKTRRPLFAGAGTEITWTLKDLAPGLPADWSPFQFLVLELRLSSPQRFDLRIHDANGVRSVRLAPVPGAWIRSAVPLSFLTQPPHSGNDLASVHNKARPMMFINLSGTPGELKSVSQLGVVMANPIGAPSLEIRANRVGHDDTE